MSDVNSVASGLQAAFALPEGALTVQRATRLWIEVGYNGIVAPFLFALLNLFKAFKQADKEGA